MARLERYDRKQRTPEVTKAIADLEGELAVPPFPKALGYVWRAYLRLRRRTAGGFSGPQPVSWDDILAYTRLFDLAPWEIELIERLDDIYLAPDPAPVAPEGQTVKVAASASDAAGVRSILGAVGKGRRVVKRQKT